MTYDVADKKRLARLFRWLKTKGIPIQNSVFLIHTSEVGMQKMVLALETKIHKKQDQIRVYRLPTMPWKMKLGVDKMDETYFPNGLTEI